MLVIRAEQLDTLCASARERFCERVVEVLRESHPQQTAGFSPRALVAMLQPAVARAHDWGLRSDRAVADFTSLWLQLGADFDGHPHVRAVLEDATLPADDRVAALVQRLSPEQWQAVTERE